MTKGKIYIAMYEALECRYDETKNEELMEYLSEANPYIFKDRNSADPVISEDFSEFVKEDTEPEKAYGCVTEYLKNKTKFSEIFSDISLEEWKELCKIVEKEKRTDGYEKV